MADSMVTPNGSIEVAVSSKIALYTEGNDTKIYYKTIAYGATPPQWVYNSTLTAGTESVLTPGASYDTVRIDSDSAYPTFYQTGATPVTEAGDFGGVTPGTVTAGKVLIVDSNKDLSALRNVTVTNLDAGASGTAGTVDVFPTTASKGKLQLVCTDQTGDTTVTVNANAMGQATTVNLADPGAAASYVVQSTAALTLAEADILDGATVTTAELNQLDAAVASITFAAASAAANVCEVTMSFKDAAGSVITGKNWTFEWWLSDAATGLGITGTAASGTVQAKSGEGSDLTALTAKKHTISQTKASAGTYVLEITDTAKTQFYVCAKHPLTGEIQVSAQLQTADYGS